WGILVIGGKGGRRYVLDDRTRRGALHEIIAVLVGTDDDPEHPRESGLVQKWRPDSILIEPKAAGPDVMDTLLEQMGKGDVPMVSIWEADPGNDDKEIRLEAAIPYICNGMVHLLDGAPWLEEFVHEISMFPNGKHDDRVDALSQCLNFRREAADEWPDM
ncbi:MAG: phage terminase large subunit, partial [Kofleriaceae bacterium]